MVQPEFLMANAPSTSSPLLRWLSVGLVVSISMVFYGTAGLMVRENTLGNDFLCFYSVGTQLNAGDGARLHDHTVQKLYQSQVQPATAEVVPFPRPRYYAEVFRPLALLPESTALSVWQFLQILGLLGVWWMLVLRYQAEVLILTSFFLPLPIGIAHGQDTGWMTFLVSLSVFVWQAGYGAWAGAILALCLFKWHLILLVPVAMVLGKQWAMLRGFVVTALVTVGVDFALDGMAGWKAYVGLLGQRDLDRMTPGLTLMPNLQGLFANLGIPGFWWIGLVFAFACFTRCALRLKWPQALLAAQLCGILAVPHSFEYDIAFLLFPLAAVVSRPGKSLAKWLAFVLLVPPLYFVQVLPSPWPCLLPLALFGLLAALAIEAWKTDTANGLDLKGRFASRAKARRLFRLS